MGLDGIYIDLLHSTRRILFLHYQKGFAGTLIPLLTRYREDGILYSQHGKMGLAHRIKESQYTEESNS